MMKSVFPTKSAARRNVIRRRAAAGFTALLMLTGGTPVMLPQADLTACAEDVTGEEPEHGYTDEYAYDKYSDHIILTRIYSIFETLTIPDQIEGLPVTVIGSDCCDSFCAYLGYDCDTIRSLYIPDTVTKIESDAFSGCSNLAEIRFPESLETIGDSAFSGCSSLTSVTFPESLETIGFAAFSGCSSLTSVTFPKSLKTIGAHAFEKCTEISEFHVPANVTEIGEGAFSTADRRNFSISGGGFGISSLTAIHVAADNPNYASVDGVLFSKDMETLLCYPIAKETENNSYTIPEGVKTIGTYAFYASNLDGILFPDSVETIEDSSFEICGALRNIICRLI